MVIRVLIINRQLVFAVTIKQALEQTGAFEVHPFTDPNAAMEYLRTHPHDVALVDFAVKAMPGAEIVSALRLIQPEIAVIVSPMQPDSSKVIRDLQLQGMIDAPFSARGIIPLIEHAVEQMSQPTQAVTRSFVEPDQPAVADTEILGRPDPGESRPRAPRHEPAQTRDLDDLPDESPRPQRLNGEDIPHQPIDTRILDTEDENLPRTRNLAGMDVPQSPNATRIFDDEDENLPPTRHLAEREMPQSPSETRILDDDENLPPTRNLKNVPRPPAETRILDDDEPVNLPQTRRLDDAPAAPPRLPEFSSLDDVLADEAPSSLFEPPLRDGDTPAVPNIDSEAVRQFLATSSDESMFDNMLGEILPEGEDAPQLPGGDFQDLVNSMRGDQPYTPLPDRHQQFVEFILTGGMDSLLSEIEKSKTGSLDIQALPAPEEKPPTKPLPPPPPSTFEKLAAEEPPMPTLEEGGTVSDLMVGVSDTSFRNVLAMMRGEETVEAPPEGSPTPSRQEIEQAYKQFFEQQIVPEPDDETPPPAPAPPRDEPSITAQLILETALDESTPAENFSLNDVIGSIERQLAEHKPEIRPLPSWNVKSIRSKQPPPQPEAEEEQLPARPAARQSTDRYVKEPDFLPEEFLGPTVHPAVQMPVDDWTEDVQEKLRQAEQNQAALERAIQQTPPEPAEDDDITRIGEKWDLLLDEDATVIGTPPRIYDAPPTLPEEFAPAEQDAGLPVDFWDDLSEEWGSGQQWDEEADFGAADSPEAAGGYDEWELTIDDAPGDETAIMQRPHMADLPVALGAGADFEPQVPQFDLAEPDDPYVAQIALSLTQVSLELAAEATLLTSDDQIVAFAGNLSQEDVEELRATVPMDWSTNPDEARIRFVTLNRSGQDFMLYSRKTVNELVLTMIFSGSMALRDIRRQGRRLIEALEAVPDVTAESPAVAVPDVATITGEMSAVEPVAAAETIQPFTYLWLLRDPDMTIDDRTARAIVAGLNLQLGELGWQVWALRAQGEYVYVHADVPGDRPAYEVINDLKRRAGEIAHAQQPNVRADTLWADSYLVMMPGRELDPDEIDQFISFERMA